MEKNKLLSLYTIRQALSWERFICRIFAAWCTFAAVTSLGEGNFYDGWMKNPYSAMISCNDGFRPVSFYLELAE